MIESISHRNMPVEIPNSEVLYKGTGSSISRRSLLAGVVGTVGLLSKEGAIKRFLNAAAGWITKPKSVAEAAGNYNPIEAAINNENPPNPYPFIMNNGDQGEWYTSHGIQTIFPDGHNGIIDQDKLSINGQPKAIVQANAKLYPNDTIQIATSAHQYDDRRKVYFFADGYRRLSTGNTIFIAIRFVPVDSVENSDSQRRMDLTFPSDSTNLIPVRFFNLAEDGSTLQLGTKNYSDPKLNAIYTIPLAIDGDASGKMSFRPAIYTLGLPVVLNQSK